METTNTPTKAGHTPAPWKSVQINSKLQVWDNDENIICQIHNIAPSENEANALLIASAPELLERLRASQQTLNRVLDEERHVITGKEYAHEHEARLRYLEVVIGNNSVAIAKAEGKE
jgi:hypothetical protein